ncbi:MAG TPA: hypothetical protein VMZ50_06675 [Phycisphaerae bacterium]|nr:hypothetical protein [Phycisphaerae bacterium]
MIKREAPRAIPDKPHYVSVDLSTNGTHHFRIPSQAVAMKKVREAKGAAEEEDPAERNSRMLLLAGAFIGDLWFHAEWDIETKRGRMSAEDYGEAIHEELHEAGYRAEDISTLIGFVGAAIGAKAINREDIDGAKAFFVQTAGRGRGSGSTSPRDSAETSAHGTE